MARAEVSRVRQQFGYLDITNPKLVHITRIGDAHANEDRYRMRLPTGSHFLLRLAEIDMATSAYPDEAPKASKTMSMNDWKDGANVVIKWSVFRDQDSNRLVVATDTEEVFNYRFNLGPSGSKPSEGTFLRTDPQKTFSPDERIFFMWHRNPNTNRGVMFWMEPVSLNKYARQSLDHAASRGSPRFAAFQNCFPDRLFRRCLCRTHHVDV